MFRCLGVVVMSCVLVTPFVWAVPVGEPPARVDPERVKELVKKLGDRDYQVRAQAQAELEKLGPGAIPYLAEELKNTKNAEIRRRLDELVPTLERVAALGPTRVTIQMKDEPVRRVVEELAKQSKFRIELSPNAGLGDEREKRVISVDLKEAPFWEALDKICEKGGLTYHEGYYGGDNFMIRLDYGDYFPGIVHVSGAFRLTARGFHYYRNLDIGGPRNGPEGPFRRHESLSINIGISTEPKIPLLNVYQPNITEALDDRNQSMLYQQNNMDRQHYYDHGGYRSYSQQVNAQLVPSAGGKSIKVLKGTVPVRVVAVSKPKITVDKLMEVKNKTFKEGSATIVIDEVTKRNDIVEVRMTITDTSVTGPNDYTWVSSLNQRLELVDDKGNRYRNQGGWNQNGNNSVNGTFQFYPEHMFGGGRGGIGLGGLFGRGGGKVNVKLVYNEWTTMTHSVPFEFKDLPLP